MRIIALSAIALLASASAALSAPAQVSVTLGSKLQEKAEKTYGVAEIHKVAEELRSTVATRLARTGAHEDSRVDLVLMDVKPNHPTFKELGDRPGLSMQSFGIGGATIEGRVTAADGVVTPVDYSWYESDIRNAHGKWIWGDAEWTFRRFANKLARGEQVAQR